MSRLVTVQLLRGVAGVEAATTVVEAAVAKYNTVPGNESHTVRVFEALKPNTKGMQVQLSLLAVLARNHGATLIRLSVHNGNVALCGTEQAIEDVLSDWQITYSAIATRAANAYTPDAGPRMAFTNAYACGLCAGIDPGNATLAYGIGTLFSFPMPGNAVAAEGAPFIGPREAVWVPLGDHQNTTIGVRLVGAFSPSFLP